MCSELRGLSFPSTSSRSSPTSPEHLQSPDHLLQSPDHLETSCFQMPESQCQQSSGDTGLALYCQRVRAPYRQKSAIAECFRRHSVDESPAGPEPGLSERNFHPYRRHCSEGAVPEVQALSSLRVDGLASKLTTDAGLEEQTSWTPLSSNVETISFMETQQPCDEPQVRSDEPLSFTSSLFSTLQQQFSGVYCPRGRDSISHHCNQSLSLQTSQDDSTPPLYTKPGYSYSILIFLALRNSKTGSLPVSEIYSFMMEHFPYFKTAPDGWRNSIRHNLSLNKCFEKVENKKGTSPRKGCLWALNPARVEKMQEELHKWRRKDPLTARRSMARPEVLEHLLGDRPQKLKALCAHFTLPSGHTHSHRLRVGMRPSCGQPPAHETSVQPQKSPYSPLSPQTAPPPPPCSFPDSFYSPVTQLSCSEHLTSPSTGNLDSPLPAHTPPSYSTALQAGHSTAGGMQELLLEEENSNDVDALNPSLTDLQLHESLWEELRNDSLTPDSLVVMDASPYSPQLSPTQAGTGVEVYGLPAGADSGSVGTEGGVQGILSELYLNQFYTTAFSSTDSTADLLCTSGNTPVPLL